MITNSLYGTTKYNERKIKRGNIKIAGLENGKRIPIEEYYHRMLESKIIMAPLGYGEAAVRDIESAMFGAVLIKPDMSNVITHPNIYIPYETYVPCKLDWSDLLEKIEWVKSNPKQCK